MKKSNTILITFWLIHPEGDLHTTEQMRAVGQAGVYAPEFKSGERKILAMEARFDIDDACARNAAIQYARQNVFLMYAVESVFGMEVRINGELLNKSV